MRGTYISVAKSKSSATTTTTGEDHVVVKYFKETRAELRKVSWPTREEATNLTMIIVIVTVTMALLLGLLDYTFQILAAGIINRSSIEIVVSILLFLGAVAAFYFNSQQE